MMRTSADRGNESTIGEDLLKPLANDTRIQILQVLWADFIYHRYVVHNQKPIPFSELLARTDIEDSGNLNYHLGKLIDTFLTKRDGGYVLTPLGYNLMRSLTTYESFESRTIEPTELEDPCPFCSEPLLATYERELLHTYCRGCEGLAGGNINYVNLPALDSSQRDLMSLLDAATIQLMTRVQSVMYGLCGQCHGSIEPSVNVCGCHDSGPGGVCKTCGRRFGADIEFECRHCGASGTGPVVECAIVSPRIESFFESHMHGPHGVGPFRYRLACLETASETIDSESTTITYTFTLKIESERVQITKDVSELIPKAAVEMNDD